MRCPNCHTENRDDREACYHCQADLTMLRLIVNKARHHHNHATELVERGHYIEALEELENALELDGKLQEAHVLRGAVLLRMERAREAERAWEQALALHPTSNRAHRFLLEARKAAPSLPMLRRLRAIVWGAAALVLLAVGAAAWLAIPAPGERALRQGMEAFARQDFRAARFALAPIPEAGGDPRITEAAQFLRRTMDETEDRLLDAARAEAIAGREAEVLSLLERLESMRPSEATSASAAQLRADMALRAAAREREAVAALPLDVIRARHHELVQRGDLLPVLEARVVELLLALPVPPAPRPALAHAAELRREAAQLLVTEASRALVERHADAIAEQAVTALLREAREAIAARPEDARAVAAPWLAIRGLPAEAARQVEAMVADAENQRRAAAAAALELALAAGADADALAAAEALQRAGGAPSIEQEDALAEARRRHAIAAYYALMERAEEIEEGRLTRARAREVLALVEAAQGHLPARLAAEAEDNLAFFAAVAHRAAGDAARANALMAELRGRAPRSPWIPAWERLVAQR